LPAAAANQSEVVNMVERNKIGTDAAGASRPPGWTDAAAAVGRRDELRQYLSDLQARRNVVARTRTKSAAGCFPGRATAVPRKCAI